MPCSGVGAAQAYAKTALHDGDVRALCGVACRGESLALRTAALEKLVSVLDGCGGEDFMRCAGLEPRRGSVPPPGAGAVLVVVHDALWRLLSLPGVRMQPEHTNGSGCGGGGVSLAEMVCHAADVDKRRAYAACREVRGGGGV